VADLSLPSNNGLRNACNLASTPPYIYIYIFIVLFINHGKLLDLCACEYIKSDCFRDDSLFSQLDAQILNFNTFIILLYMFRALLCSSSGGQMHGQPNIKICYKLVYSVKITIMIRKIIHTL